MTVPKHALLYCAVRHLPHTLPIQLVVLVHPLVHRAVGVRYFADAIQLMVFEDAFEHLAFDGYGARLAIQIVVLEMSLAKLFLINVVPEPIQLVQTVLVYHLAGEGQLLVFVVVDDEGAPYLRNLAEVLPVLHAHELPNAFDPELVLKLKFALLIQLAEI